MTMEDWVMSQLNRPCRLLSAYVCLCDVGNHDYIIRVPVLLLLYEIM